MVAGAEVVADGVRFGEGPIWTPDGELLVTSVADGALYHVDPDAHLATKWADTGGGANGAYACADGGVLVTQNGGFDFTGAGLFEHPPPYRPVEPGLQHVAAGGAPVTYLVDGMQAPNDLAMGPDGAMYFTDPPRFPPPEEGAGRVMKFERDGTCTEFARSFFFCNGIAFEPDGTMVVIERTGLWRVREGGEREPVIEVLGEGGGDGFCLDTDGRFYVASTVEGGVRVVDPDGTIVDFLEAPDTGLVTNCCFGGPDLRTLFATQAIPGRVVAWHAMPTPGLELPYW